MKKKETKNRLILFIGIFLLMGNFNTVDAKTDIAVKNTKTPKEKKEKQVWASQHGKSDVPNIKVQVENNRVSVEFLKDPLTQMNSIGMTFFDSSGDGTRVELKAIEPKASSVRYEANYNRIGSFVGFEVKIPLKRGKTTTIHSHEMKKLK
ncbi:MAG: hypothetical protein CL678_12195 [Bdellovibrionaceae bacterium]|nr:hypothetical protein [Pseudobdellovibrionaceae bacterium]|tara:strand:+ start:1655 stop:2104 length:450 start_codon:yes stop_codon:yes gene_type:complete